MVTLIIVFILYILGMYLLSKSSLRGSGLNYALTVLFLLISILPVMSITYTTNNIYKINDLNGKSHTTIKSLENGKSTFDYIILVGNTKNTKISSLKVSEDNLLIKEGNTDKSYLSTTRRTTIILYLRDNIISLFSKDYRNNIEDKYLSNSNNYKLVIPKDKVSTEIGFPKGMYILD